MILCLMLPVTETPCYFNVLTYSKNHTRISRYPVHCQTLAYDSPFMYKDLATDEKKCLYVRDVKTLSSTWIN